MPSLTYEVLDLLIDDGPSEMLIGRRERISELSDFFSQTCLFLIQFSDYFIHQNLLHDFFLLMFFSFLSINITKKFILVYVVDNKNSVRNCKELFIANSSSYKTRIRQCWFYFFKFAFLHAFLRFDERKKMWNANANAVFFFSWDCVKHLIASPRRRNP